MSEASQLFFNCVILDDDEDPLLQFYFSANANLSSLKDDIYRRKSTVYDHCRVPPGKLRLYTPKHLRMIPLADLRKRAEDSLLSAEWQQLEQLPVSMIWSGDINDKIHVVVVGKRAREALKQVDIERDIISRRFRAIKLGEDARAPSDASKPSHYRSEQEARPLYNGRPESLRGPPIVLYNAAFARLKDGLCKLETITPSPDELGTTLKFMKAAVQIYKSEKERSPALVGLLQDLLGYNIGLKRLRDSKAEGDGIILVGREGWLAATGYWELKNETGSAGIPDYQAACTYRKHVVDKEYAAIRSSTCCPCLIISMPGPYMSLQGAIFVDAPIVQPFTDYIFLGGDPEYEDRVLKLARMFRLAKRTLAELEEFYASVNYSTEISREALLPRPILADPAVTFPRVNFTDRLFKQDMVRPIYLAKMGDQDVVVKFTRQYCENAHRLLGQHRLAPQLYLCAPVLGGYWMVVMEYLDGVDGHKFLSEHGFSRDVYDNIRRAIQLLHSRDYVFGDLRPQNVMIMQGDRDSDSGEHGTAHFKSFLVDFDWCGKHARARYPASMNTALNWAKGVAPLGLMKKEHDTYRLQFFSDSGA